MTDVPTNGTAAHAVRTADAITAKATVLDLDEVNCPVGDAVNDGCADQ